MRTIRERPEAVRAAAALKRIDVDTACWPWTSSAGR
jgi:hypothetical protein